jgi:integrase/recombinase XerD
MEEQVYAFIEYLASHKRYAANTLAAYRNDLLQFAQFISTERPSLRSWARVDPLLLQAFLLNMKLREYSAASIARRIAAIKAFYFYLFEQHEIVANPTLDLDSPPVAKRPPQALTEEQVEKLLSTAAAASPKGYRDRAILELLYATGLRVSELVALEVSTVDLAAGTLRVGGDAAFRSIPLNDRAREALVLYLERGRAALKAPGDGGPLFVNPRGKQLTRQGIWLILKH